MSKKTLFFAAAILLAAFGLSNAADTLYVGITGRITDLTGKGIVGASITIPEVNLDTTSDLSGNYGFDALATAGVRTPLVKSAISSRPVLSSDGLHFFVGPSSQLVKIDVFTLQGRQVLTVGNRMMSSGSYRVNPFAGLSASQTYVMSVKIGDQVSHFRVPLAGGLTAGQVVFRKTTGNAPASPSAKKAARVGTLNVTASGFSPVSLPLDSFQGTHVIMMKTAAQASKKLLTFNFNLSQDTVSSHDAIDQVLAIWAEDMTAKYIRTLYVTPWLSTTGITDPVNACGAWLTAVDTAKWDNLVATNQPAVDAVTSATPVWGKSSIDCNPDSISAQAGSFRMCFEAHVTGIYNILYVDTIPLGGAAGSYTPHVTYIPSKDPGTLLDGLNSVVISYQ
ncbi:MAG TPA: hypothetical protein VKF42_10535 [Chitinivibrionales bacterium]|jgi:hypothetical protein|nr:hypothetical protein [Chitinivibrionales bacterium]